MPSLLLCLYIPILKIHTTSLSISSFHFPHRRNGSRNRRTVRYRLRYCAREWYTCLSLFSNLSFSFSYSVRHRSSRRVQASWDESWYLPFVHTFHSMVISAKLKQEWVRSLAIEYHVWTFTNSVISCPIPTLAMLDKNGIRAFFSLSTHFSSTVHVINFLPCKFYYFLFIITMYCHRVRTIRTRSESFVSWLNA